MKNHTATRPQRPINPAQTRRTATPRAPDPIEQHATERRLYTDFLALAFYPGMRPARPPGPRANAA